jgi:hypothetical protein
MALVWNTKQLLSNELKERDVTGTPVECRDMVRINRPMLQRRNRMLKIGRPDRRRCGFHGWQVLDQRLRGYRDYWGIFL